MHAVNIGKHRDLQLCVVLAHTATGTSAESGLTIHYILFSSSNVSVCLPYRLLEVF